MELPRPLTPWLAYLELFPRDLALALGPLIQRLNSLIGAFPVESHSEKGIPDGFEGIARRGTYERLLLSEWLLAEEIPEEFLRRAAVGEHAFLQLAHREPASIKTSVVLFDSGPNQWGTPRIAQLAALIVLARRASASGANFLWGVLQNPEKPLFSEVTASRISELFKTHSARDPIDTDLFAWREQLNAQQSDDFWIVGGQSLGQAPYTARHFLPSNRRCL